MKYVALSEACQINPRISPIVATEKDRIVDFVPMAQLGSDGRITTTESRRLGDVLKGYRYFENGDVIVAKITPCMENGKAAHVQSLPHGIAFGSTEFHVLRPHQGIDPRYIFYSVWTPEFRQEAANNMTGTGGQQRVPASFFDRFTIPLPPLAEQRRIADILDKADGIRRKRREAVADFSHLKEALFNQTFGDLERNERGWPKLPFESVLQGGLRNGISPSSNGTHLGRVLVLSAITGGSFDDTAVKQGLFSAPLGKDQLVNPEEFLICRGNGNIHLVGTGRFPKPTMEATAFPDTMIAARLDATKVVREYLEDLWTTGNIRGQIEACARTTNGTFKVNQKGLSSIEVLLPPLHIQQKYASTVRFLDGIRHRMLSTDYVSLFNSLVQKAFCAE